MNIQQLALAPLSQPTPYRLAAGLNLVDTRSGRHAQAIAELVGHVLYGARVDYRGSAELDQPGYVDVTSPLGRFRLERHADRVDRGSFTEPRLTVAPLDGQQARPHTLHDLLGGMSPAVASRLFVLGSSSEPQLAWLLSEELASELCRLEQQRPAASTSHQYDGANHDLFGRRDRLSHEIEQLLAEKRRSSEALESALREISLEIQGAERSLGDHRRELDRALAELAELETQLRYHELSEFVGRATDEAYHSDQQPELAGLDEEIAKWRRALGELEAREAHVRHRLTQLHPDDSSPLLPLADQRACVSIAQRLVADLDSEVARYARPGDSNDCLCQHTHARLHPLVDTLRHQVDKLSHLVEQYEAAVRIEQLKIEIEHLARSQAELRSTIEHLLDRRQSRLRTSRVRADIEHLDGLPTDWQRRHAELERRQGELRGLLADDQRRLDEFASRRERLHRDRAELLNDGHLGSLREQLDDLTRQIDRGATTLVQTRASTAPWRASDVLAKLSDGRLREVRLSEGGRHASVVNRQGTLVPQSQLNDVDRRLLTLSLQLAAVAGASQWGLTLPLIVADPFAQLPAAESAILALVLHDFARSGHQVLLTTASTAVIDRLRSLGQTVLGVAEPKVETRVATQLLDPVNTPRTSTITLHQGDLFALKLDDDIERFSVFGRDTAEVFSAVGIQTIDELLDADSDALSIALDRTGISSSIVELWQTHVAMLVYVPNLTLQEVQLLTGAGIRTIDELCEADGDQLYQAVEDYLDSPRGVRHRSLRSGFSRQRVANWISDARRERQRWSESRYASRWSRRRNSERGTRRTHPRSERNGTRKRKTTTRQHSEQPKRPLRFRLSRTSPVVDAPSVGPKTAKRLAKIGITTVADLLSADAEATADALGMKHISAETIVAWQHQSQLMCRVPELLARDTQVLVGCGFTTPEDIATADAADLYEFAKSYTATSEGTRVLRGSDPPDLARVTKWVFWAGHRRAMEAA